MMNLVQKSASLLKVASAPSLSIKQSSSFLKLATAGFSRKTKKYSTGQKRGNYNEDEAFTPPGEDSQSGGTPNFSGKRIYVPKVPLKFDNNGRLLLFEISSKFKNMPRL